MTTLPGFVPAQSNIDAEHRFSWGENIGWIKWHDVGNGDRGARVGTSTLAGFIWADGAGWIYLGDGSPATGVHYANINGADFGVNIDASGDLFGLAWGTNITLGGGYRISDAVRLD